jgi:hypothetical protein
VTRHLANWLEEYVKYASVGEAPKIFHFWAGVSAVAGALRRKVWFDQIKFQWYPSFYIIFVAPPGVATKSVTADGSMDLLRQVPGIHFGPDEVTWQQLVTSFASASESFLHEGDYFPMSPITILSSEFGMMMDFKDSKMVNLFITLWDGRKQFEKQTKMSGNDMIEAPWINMIACTTPQWISSNMDANTIGGGFTSRCIFVYGDKKERPVAYIKNQVRFNYAEVQATLVHDLEHISLNLTGEYKMTEEAEAWGEAWYTNLWEKVYSVDNQDYVNNYLARKQAHLHKLAMVLAASKRDELTITLEDFTLAQIMLDETEEKFRHVFSKVGGTEETRSAGRLLSAIEARGVMTYTEVYKFAQTYFPDATRIEDIIQTFVRSGQVELHIPPEKGIGGASFKWVGEREPR